jgi:FkbM family methyltransferase
MEKFNLITNYFQKLVKTKDIRIFKKNIFYYFLFRMCRSFLNKYIVVKIYDFRILASNKKNHTSHGLLKKCHFDDEHELSTIKKFSRENKVFLLDCGCNYGFYSFYTASLSKKNFVIAVEASLKTSQDFNNNLVLNNYNNIILKNLAISDKNNEILDLNESYNDWESSLSHNNFKNKELTKINTTTIKKILEGYNLENFFLFIKLDIEGYEFKAIQGGLDEIKRYNPIIIIEFSKYIFENDITSVNFLKNFLIDYDYSIYGTDKKKINVDEVIILLKDLNPQHKTIGNYYLIKNDKTINQFLNDG